MTFLSVATTSGLLIALLHSLASSPQHVIELLEEQEYVIQQKSDNHVDSSLLNADDYKKLVKLDSYIREAFRHMDDFDHPHVNTTKNNVVLSNGTIIRPGEEVFTNFWHLNFDPTVQSDLEEDLEEFKPFRFVGREKQATKCSNDYLPFGLGR
ncbi:cytochrome P450 [Circinella umbellata]|nr:cytochrome P450 [Circinella umbellata]